MPDMQSFDPVELNSGRQAPPPEPPLPVGPPEPAPTATKPVHLCAQRLDQVEMAWQLVFERYVQKQLIDDNPFHLHTMPSAVGSHVCVVYGPRDGNIGSTMTLISDNPDGVPLDCVYQERLGALRREGRGLVEVGLLADRRQRPSRSTAALFSMMRWAAYYTLHTNATDIVAGVHPRHVGFYVRCFGFERFGMPTLYPMVRDNPVVPLRLPLRDALAEKALPRGLAFVRDNPIPGSAFSQRFSFEPEQLRGSLIERFLDTRYGPARTPKPEAEPSKVASLLGEILPDLADPSPAF